jgi:hypothetical protein
MASAPKTEPAEYDAEIVYKNWHKNNIPMLHEKKDLQYQVNFQKFHTS